MTSSKSRAMPILWMVIPCFNEEQALQKTPPIFLEVLQKLIDDKEISDESRICFVDDGSTDDTWAAIVRYAARDPHFVGVSLSRNEGHQSALLAGLMEAKKHCDISISLDCDGQDDITAVFRMIDEYKKGNEVVYAVRQSRSTDTFFKRKSAEWFYKFMAKMGVDVVFNAADYRLLSVVALEALSQFKEVNLFLRGIIPLLGYPSTLVYFDRHERVAGDTHYPLSKMVSLAINGVTSFSTKPIHMVFLTGVVFSLVGLCGIIWAVVMFVLGNTIAGWASIICAVLIVGGLTLLGLGIIGEYVGKIYLEVKARPRYFIYRRTWENSSSDDEANLMP